MTTQLRYMQGTDRFWPVQCWLDGAVTPAAFGASDGIAAYVYGGQDQVQLVSLSTEPFTDFIPQTGQVGTGYPGGQVTLGLAAADGATLEQDGDYLVRVLWTPAGTNLELPVWNGQLVVEPMAGTSTRVVPAYCTYADMLLYASWAAQINDSDTDQEGFYTQRLQARKWLDWLIVKSWRGGAWGVFGDASRPASEWSGWGMWRTPLPSPYLQNMLAGGYVPQNGVTRSAAGTGYFAPPTVTAPAPTGSPAGGGQVQAATFMAALDGTGGVGSVVVSTPGLGYTPGSTLTLTFAGGGGSGAAATAAVSAGALMLRDQIIRLCAYKAISLVGMKQIGTNNQYAAYAAYFADLVSAELQQTVAELDINGDGLADTAIPLGRTNTIYE